MKAFTTSSNFDDSYVFIGFNSELMCKKEGFEFTSSYHVLGARLLGLSYPDFLKYVWDKAADKKGMQEIIRQLNANWDTLLKEVSL